MSEIKVTAMTLAGNLLCEVEISATATVSELRQLISGAAELDRSIHAEFLFSSSPLDNDELTLDSVGITSGATVHVLHEQYVVSLLTGCDDGKVRQFDLKSGLQFGKELCLPRDVGGLAVDGSLVYIGCDDNAVHCYSLQTGAEIRKYAHPDALIWANPCIHPNGTSLFTGGTDKKIREFDVESCALLRSFEIVGGGPVGGLLCNKTCTELYVGTAEDQHSKVYIVDPVTTDILESFALPRSVGNMSLNRDETSLFISCHDNVARQIEIRRGDGLGSVIKEFYGAAHSSWAVALHPSQSWLFVADHNCHVHQFEVASVRKIRDFAHPAPIIGLAFANIYPQSAIDKMCLTPGNIQGMDVVW